MFNLFRQRKEAKGENKKGDRGPKKFDPYVLRKNDISLLILDERWNGLFASIEKPREITECEEAIKELLKEQARLIAEQKEIPVVKKSCMDKILELTTKAYGEGDQEAIQEMQSCEIEIKRINNRIVEIEERLEKLPDDIKEKNIELLGYAVNAVYLKIRGNQLKVKKLEALIEESKKQLKEYIEEKESINQDQSEIYSYFHDLIGGEELEKLDREFFTEGEKQSS